MNRRGAGEQSLARNAAIEKRAILLTRGGEEKTGNKGGNYSLGYKKLQRSTYILSRPRTVFARRPCLPSSFNYFSTVN
jgi:hypothetical protein